MKDFWKLVFSVGVSLSAGVIGSFFTTPAVQSSWYLELVKPSLNPPSWVFGTVWTTLYVLIGISLFLVWKQHSDILQNVGMFRIWKVGIVAFFVQLVLNTLWSIIFFGLHSPGGALVEIVFLLLAILATIFAFYKISKPAACLLLPYILWVSFASYLNYTIWVLN